MAQSEFSQIKVKSIQENCNEKNYESRFEHDRTRGHHHRLGIRDGEELLRQRTVL